MSLNIAHFVVSIILQYTRIVLLILDNSAVLRWSQEFRKRGGGKGRRSSSVYEIVVRSREGGAVYIYCRSVNGDAMQGKRLMSVFEDDRKYFGLLGLDCGGV